MHHHTRTILAALALSATLTKAQATGSTLHVEFVNATSYFSGYCNVGDIGMNPSKLTRPTPPPPLVTGVGIADIISVNGIPVKGTAIEGFNGALLSPTMTPGRAIADFMASPTNATFELTFLNLDGSLIGTMEIHGQGTASNVGPPGAPVDFPGGSVYTVTGGTGPFLGARGYFAPVQDATSPERQTTDCEDPSYRRINADSGGNKRHPVLYLIPQIQPQIAVTAGLPAVYHLDFTPVTAGKPAVAGETLIAMATGLGPTRPGIDPGQPFPSFPGNALQQVSSPLGLTINQQPAQIFNAVGWPGLVDIYRIDFQIPAGTSSGQASVQISIAWMNGPAVSIPIE